MNTFVIDLQYVYYNNYICFISRLYYITHTHMSHASPCTDNMVMCYNMCDECLFVII